MIFLDSNIAMYLVGAPHPHKTEAQILLERVTAAGERLVTDAEVFQEVLHRYTALKRPKAITDSLQLLLGVVDEVMPIDLKEVLRAAEIVQHPAALSARDAIHVAIMERHAIKTIMSFDADFDRWQGISRLHEV